MKRLIRYFIQGVIITVPVAITVIVIYKLVVWIGSLFDSMGVIVSPVIDPFIVILIVLFIILLSGILGSSIILRPIFLMFDHALEHTPFIKTIYSSIKDLLSAFVGSKKRFNRPVLVTINRENNIRQLGFITREDLIDLKISADFVAVYVPLSYSFSGNLLVVPRDHITVVDSATSEVMKFIISGGVTDIEDQHHPEEEK